VDRELRDRITGCLSPVIHLAPQSEIGPNPIQLVVVIAVTNAVSAATIIFTAISIIRFFFIAN
jgi:hypothetical protein